MAERISHKLMLKAGMIQQLSSGLYAWLPMGLRVLQKISSLIREEHDREGCSELLMPTIQPGEIWKESGRYHDYGKEMLHIHDRHGRDLVYGPTNEELITYIARTHITSYKDLPKRMYHIQWKFRDEIRPRFGVMRAREFLMKDSYSFDESKEAAIESFYLHFLIYWRIFKRMGVRAVPVRATTGPIGGDLSYEFSMLCKDGENNLVYDKRALDNPPEDLTLFKEHWEKYYLATDDMIRAFPPKNKNNLTSAAGIEIGHIFFFGDKYSRSMNAFFTQKEGTRAPIQMGSYGIGISRLVAALIEGSHDHKGIIWNKAVAPFLIHLMNLGKNSRKAQEAYQVLGHLLPNDVLYDDRGDVRAGAKLYDADLVGIPWQVISGDKDGFEVKRRATGEVHKLQEHELEGFVRAEINTGAKARS